MSVSYSQLKKIAFFCLMLPTAVFFLGFLKPYIGIPATLLLCAAYVFSIRKPGKPGYEFDGSASEQEKRIEISLSSWILLILFVVIWCFLSGLGNLYYQSDDWSARNAIFRDLISHEWPVIYDIKDSALVYYIGFWLPSSLVGKMIYLIGGSLDIAFLVGNIALWLFTAFYLVVTILVTAVFVRANTKKRFFLLLLGFLLFSGLDIVGTLYNYIANGIPIPNHVEWWSDYQFSSMATCLGWVFNQAVLAWLATACFLNERTTRNYAWIVVLCASSAPLPCVGLGVYMIGVAAVHLFRAIRDKKGADFARNVFTLQNIISALAVFPIYVLYYMTNLAVNVGGSSADTMVLPLDGWAMACIFLSLALILLFIFLRRKKKIAIAELWVLLAINVVMIAVAWFNHDLRIQYVFAVLLEGLIFLPFLWKDRRRDPLLYMTIIVVLMCPLIHVGTAADFCMRASIPAMFVLMAFCVRALFDHAKGAKDGQSEPKERKIRRVLCVGLAVVMLLGVFTPYKEFERGVKEVVAARKLNAVNDSTETFDQVFDGERKNLDRNFIATNYSEKLFFKYLAK